MLCKCKRAPAQRVEIRETKASSRVTDVQQTGLLTPQWTALQAGRACKTTTTLPTRQPTGIQAPHVTGCSTAGAHTNSVRAATLLPRLHANGCRHRLPAAIQARSLCHIPNSSPTQASKSGVPT
jgi:hypothetical protein